MSILKSFGGGRQSWAKSITVPAAALALALAQGAPAAHALGTPGGASWDTSKRGTAISLTGYKMSFDDEFNSLDLACFKWGSAGSHRWYMYDNTTSGIATVSCANGYSSNVSVSNGVLALTTLGTAGAWRGASIATMDPFGEGFKQQYGYFEARVKLPASTAAKVDWWPSFWAQGRYTSSGSAYAYPEMDVLESWSMSGGGNNQATLHSWPSSPVNSAILPAHQQAPFATGSHVLDSQWHVYGFRFTSTYWTIYFDGHELARYPVNQALMKMPIYPILDVAVSPSTTATASGVSYTMYVDYVHVYACNSSACQTG